ncbi:MAG: hypothetical protein QM691_11140 [Opitutaceae bacterium]
MTNARATIQTADILHVGNKTYMVHGLALPDELRTKIEETHREMGEQRRVWSSNWDGFYATLELRDSRLYLTALEIDWIGAARKPIVLGRANALFCAWFSGELLDVKLGKHGRNILRRDIFFFKDGVLVRTKVEKKPFWRKSL